MSYPKEIITLQFGKHANFVATHFWNILYSEIQSKYNQDDAPTFAQYFREGETHDRLPTFTPRCVIFDEKKEWRSLKAEGYLYNREEQSHHESSVSTHDSIEVMKEEEYGMSKFMRRLLASDPSTVKYVQQEAYGSSGTTNNNNNDDVYDVDGDLEMDQQVKKEKKALDQVSNYNRDDILNDLEHNSKFWTDFLIPHLHPKSVVKLPDMNFDDSRRVLSVQDIVDRYMEDSMDQIRFFLEEADHVSGIQLFCNTGDWWSSVTSQFLPQILDEFGKIPIFSTMVQPHISAQDLQNTDMSKFMSYTALGLIDHYDHTDYVLPLSATQFYEWNNEYLNMGTINDPINAYKWSSVLGVAWESLSRGINQLGLRDWLTKMTPRSGLRIGVLDARIPLGIGTDDNLHDFLMRSGPLHDRKSMICLSPCELDKMQNNDDLPYAQSIVYRGIDSNINLYKPNAETKSKLSMEEIFLQHVLNSSSVMSAQSRTEYTSRSNSGAHKTVLSDCTTYSEMLDRYIAQTPSYMTSRCYLEKPSVIPYAFPRIFNTKLLNAHGFVDQQGTATKIESIPMMVHAKTSGDIYGYLQQLQDHYSRTCRSNISIPGYELSKDEAREKLETLLNVIENYRDD